MLSLWASTKTHNSGCWMLDAGYGKAYLAELTRPVNHRFIKYSVNIIHLIKCVIDTEYGSDSLHDDCVRGNKNLGRGIEERR